MLPQELEHKSQELRQPLYVETTDLAPAELSELESISAAVREKGRVSPEVMRNTVLKLCQGRYLGLRILASLLGRDAADLSRRVLNPLVKEEKSLRRAFPRPNDPRQAYTSTFMNEKDTVE